MVSHVLYVSWGLNVRLESDQQTRQIFRIDVLRGIRNTFYFGLVGGDHGYVKCVSDVDER